MKVARGDLRALARFSAISAVLARVTEGMSLSRAIAEVTKLPIIGPDGQHLRCSRASLYRWCKAFEAKKLEGLYDDPRPKVVASRVLPAAFIDFMVKEKKIDSDASVPEIIRRAEIDGVIPNGSVSRVSAWRAADRLNLKMFATKNSRYDDVRRFSHEYRMRMVLCDGKHFRVNATKLRRVVFSFIDDATRKVLAAVVGSTENRWLFLRGIISVIRRYGLMDGIYVDRGPGFISQDAKKICGTLKIPLVFGRAQYPAGHGKIERYNQTLENDLLRGISSDPGIDPSYAALELRIEHYLTHQYNARKHHAFDEKESPDERWLKNVRELNLPDDMRKIEACFVLTETRRVSRDNVVMVDNIPYEMPRGYRGLKIQIFRHLLEDRVTVLDGGRHVALSKIDLHANAIDQRLRRIAAEEPPLPGKIRTAAQRQFEKDYGTIVSLDGDFYEKD